MVLRTFNVPHESRLGWSWWWRQRRPSVRRHYRCRPCTWRRRRVAQMYRLQQFRYLRLRRRHSIFAGAHRSFHLVGPGLRIDTSFPLLPQQTNNSACPAAAAAASRSANVAVFPSVFIPPRPPRRGLRRALFESREMSRPRYERHYRRLAKQRAEDLSRPLPDHTSRGLRVQYYPHAKLAASSAVLGQRPRRKTGDAHGGQPPKTSLTRKTS